MSSEEIKKDPFIKSIFDEGGIEQPTGGFTNQIINNIKAQSKESAFVYTPIISRKAWQVIAFLGLILFIYLLFGTTSEGQGFDFFGHTLTVDTSIVKSIFSKIAFSFTLSPILKTSFLALIFFTFTNLLIFELKNRSFFK